LCQVFADLSFIIFDWTWYSSSISNPYFKTVALSSLPLHIKLVFPTDLANTNLFISLDLLTKAISNKLKNLNLIQYHRNFFNRYLIIKVFVYNYLPETIQSPIGNLAITSTCPKWNKKLFFVVSLAETTGGIILKDTAFIIQLLDPTFFVQLKTE